MFFYLFKQQTWWSWIPQTTYWYWSVFPWSGVTNGLSHDIENGWPNTAFRFIHFVFLAHFLSSFFNCSIPVSSVQMECTCVPNITDVKMRKRSPSKHKRMSRITVVGGEKELHVVQSSSKQYKKWTPTIIRACKEISAIYIVNNTKNFWFVSPTQLLTQGQWWSIFRIHRLQTLQWWALSGLMLQHFGHL